MEVLRKISVFVCLIVAFVNCDGKASHVTRTFETPKDYLYWQYEQYDGSIIMTGRAANFLATNEFKDPEDGVFRELRIFKFEDYNIVATIKEDTYKLERLAYANLSLFRDKFAINGNKGSIPAFSYIPDYISNLLERIPESCDVSIKNELKHDYRVTSLFKRDISLSEYCYGQIISMSFNEIKLFQDSESELVARHRLYELEQQILENKKTNGW